MLNLIHDTHVTHVTMSILVVHPTYCGPICKLRVHFTLNDIDLNFPFVGPPLVRWLITLGFIAHFDIFHIDIPHSVLISGRQKLCLSAHFMKCCFLWDSSWYRCSYIWGPFNVELPAVRWRDDFALFADSELICFCYNNWLLEIISFRYNPSTSW